MRSLNCNAHKIFYLTLSSQSIRAFLRHWDAYSIVNDGPFRTLEDLFLDAFMTNFLCGPQPTLYTNLFGTDSYKWISKLRLRVLDQIHVYTKYYIIVVVAVVF